MSNIEYKFVVDENTLIPSTPTVVAFIRAMMRMNKASEDTYTSQEVIKYAVDNGLWKTKQAEDKWHTTWAFYKPDLMKLGLKQISKGSSRKVYLTIDELGEE